MTKLKIGVITAAVAAGIAIPVVIQHRMQTRLNAANESLRQQVERNNQLAAENENSPEEQRWPTPLLLPRKINRSNC